MPLDIKQYSHFAEPGEDFDPYAALGIEKTASTDEIKKKYRELSLKLHPDKNPNKEAAVEQYQKIIAAYEILSDSDAKEEYDDSIRRVQTNSHKKQNDYSQEFKQSYSQQSKQYDDAQRWENFNRTVHNNRELERMYADIKKKDLRTALQRIWNNDEIDREEKQQVQSLISSVMGSLFPRSDKTIKILQELIPNETTELSKAHRYGLQVLAILSSENGLTALKEKYLTDTDIDQIIFYLSQADSRKSTVVKNLDALVSDDGLKAFQNKRLATSNTQNILPHQISVNTALYKDAKLVELFISPEYQLAEEKKIISSSFMQDYPIPNFLEVILSEPGMKALSNQPPLITFDELLNLTLQVEKPFVVQAMLSNQGLKALKENLIPTNQLAQFEIKDLGVLHLLISPAGQKVLREGLLRVDIAQSLGSELTRFLLTTEGVSALRQGLIKEVDLAGYPTYELHNQIITAINATKKQALQESQQLQSEITGGLNESDVKDITNCIKNDIAKKEKSQSTLFTLRDKVLEMERNKIWATIANGIAINPIGIQTVLIHVITENIEATRKRFAEKNENKTLKNAKLDLGKIYENVATLLRNRSPEAFKKVIQGVALKTDIKNDDLGIFLKNVKGATKEDLKIDDHFKEDKKQGSQAPSGSSPKIG
jgi:curved DNA-binding protein CbpA